MSAKLSLDKLREELRYRGLDASGSKSVISKRLEEAIKKDFEERTKPKVAPAAEGNTSGSKKRARGAEEPAGGADSMDLEKLREMSVRELKELASKLGVLGTGHKMDLVKRLSDHLEKTTDGVSKPMEEKVEAVKKENMVTSTKKRARGAEELAGGANTVNVEKLSEMSVRELKELASKLGVTGTGQKKDLVKRLSEHLEKATDCVSKPKEEEGVEAVKKEIMVTATKKGRAVLDQWLPDNVKSSYHVLQEGDEIYDAMLNQTNVGDNNNKFYVIQALESDDGRTFMVYNRWGRVGVRGQEKLHGPFTSKDTALSEFRMKFFDKTRNEWSARKNFTCHPKCYTWLEMDYNMDEKETVANKDEGVIGSEPRETKLEPRLAKFISLICNISMMKQQMLEIGYNADKLPLGKLSKATISKGYDVLRRISDVIAQSDRKKLEELSGEFYTVIPHDFGFRKMRDFVIDTPYKLKGKIDMVAALGEIEIATKILDDDDTSQDDPLYSHYQHLCCELTPIDPISEEFSMVQRYMVNTRAKTHSNYAVEIVHLFKVSREGEPERFNKFSNVKNRMLLWHGSRLTNWTGILSQGLRIAPPEAPVTGYMFGKGVYFADMFSKSANYCCATSNSSCGVLLLCEVALGDMAELLNANYKADCLPPGKLSTKGVGATAPDMAECHTLDDGVVVPLGKPKQQADQKGSLLYNEYIVYNVEQIRMRYVIQVNFNFKR